MSSGRNTPRILVKIVLVLVIIQAVPYGRDHTNPPVKAGPEWDSPRTRDLFFHSCGDCHSNTTVWPWYSSVAPVSWLVQHDVEEGRSELNVSEWGRARNEGPHAAKMVREEEMPLIYYLPLHPEARLTSAERKELVDGLVRTFGESDEEHEHGGDSDDD